MTKIYAKGNYIVIEANNEIKPFQKKGVGFEIVNYDGLYSLNDKGLPIGDFNYSEVKKEDGSDYATPLEFETFLFENTGNFNSGADVSPNVIENKLDKGTYTGTAQDLKNDIDTKQKKLSSFDESILIETDGNIEVNVSLFQEYFEQQVCVLNFTPIQIIGVYKNGVKLLPEEFNITLPKKITIKTYSTEKIEIQYTHLK